MFRRFALLALLSLPAFLTAAEPASKLPAYLQLVPPDSAIFLHVNVEVAMKGKLGAALKENKGDELKAKLAEIPKVIGVGLDELESYVLVYPQVENQLALMRGMSIMTARKEFDRTKMFTFLKDAAKTARGEAVEKDNVLTVTLPSPFDVNNKMVTIHDLSDAKRLVSLTGLKAEFLKPQDEQGLHTEAIRKAATEAFVLAVNFNALPEELRKELPPQLKAFQSIFLADSAVVIGKETASSFEIELKVKSKDKSNALEVEKALDAGSGLIKGFMPEFKKNIDKGNKNAKAFGELLDGVDAMLDKAKFNTEEKVTTVKLGLASNLPFGPFFDLVAGGGASERSIATNNLKQMGLAMHNHDSAYGFLPPAATLGKKGKKLLSWRVAILPYIEQNQLYQQFKLDEPWDSEHNLKVVKDNPMPKVYAMPGTKNLDDKKTHFQVFTGNGAWFDGVGPTKFPDITDGTSNTIMIAAAAKAVDWAKPDDIEFDPKADLLKLLFIKDDVFLVAMGDGSIRAIKKTITEATLKAAITRGGGEVVGEDFE